jgi:hypothetical protein
MSAENEQSQAGPIAESTAVTDNGTKAKPKALSASTKTVWKSNDNAVLIATLVTDTPSMTLAYTRVASHSGEQ